MAKTPSFSVPPPTGRLDDSEVATLVYCEGKKTPIALRKNDGRGGCDTAGEEGTIPLELPKSLGSARDVGGGGEPGGGKS